MQETPQIAAASKTLAVLIAWLVPFAIGATWHILTYDWNSTFGHGFEHGTSGFLLGLLTLTLLAACSASAYAVSMAFIPAISVRSEPALWTLSAAAGVIGPAAIWGVGALISLVLDLPLNAPAKRWVDENFPTALVLLFVTTAASVSLLMFLALKAAFAFNWLLVPVNDQVQSK